MKRFFIIGTMGSGKTTLAKKIANKINSKYSSLDDIYWTKKYTKKRSEKSRKNLVNRIINKDKWVIEGVFCTWVKPIAKKAEIVVWLNMPKFFTSKNIIKRYIKNIFKGTEKERGNFSEIWKTLIHARKYQTGQHKNSYSGHKDMLERSKANYIHIKNEKELNNFLESIN